MLPRCVFDSVPSTFLPVVSRVFPVSMMQPRTHVHLCCATELRVNSKHLFWPSPQKTNIIYIKCNSLESCSIYTGLLVFCASIFISKEQLALTQSAVKSALFIALELLYRCFLIIQSGENELLSLVQMKPLVLRYSRVVLLLKYF